MYLLFLILLSTDKTGVYLFLSHHSLVEVKLFSFKNNTVAAATLTRSAGDLGEKTAGGELVVKRRLEGAILLPSGNLALDVVGLLLVRVQLRRLALLKTDLEAVVSLIPLLEGWASIRTIAPFTRVL